ncbi:hypothetical protein RHO13_00920 [Orbus wheelerorum]|uniref:hypothetical protein n=1 Tax=Orbus wheelerorum TaxID=3074111 RepID=UPI00370D02EA
MKNNKLSNKIAIIVGIPLLIIVGAYSFYHEFVLEGKDISGSISIIVMFFVMFGVYFLLKKGFSIINIKIVFIFISAVLLFIGNLLNW